MIAWLAVIAGMGVATMAAVGGIVSLVCALIRYNRSTPTLARSSTSPPYTN